VCVYNTAVASTQVKISGHIKKIFLLGLGEGYGTWPQYYPQPDQPDQAPMWQFPMTQIFLEENKICNSNLKKQKHKQVACQDNLKAE